MNARDMQALGVPKGQAINLATQCLKKSTGLDRKELSARLAQVCENPADFLGDPVFSELAEHLSRTPPPPPSVRDQPVPWRQWGQDIDQQAIEQMNQACLLPVSVLGALMPDAHVGYGLPIGGVLATQGAVIPYAVGVDIACRMKLSIFDMPVEALERDKQALIKALEEETRFGVGATHKKPKDHAVMDRDWGLTRLTRSLRDKAGQQLGTSGSGNHFVEFGSFRVDKEELGLAPGTYLALLSHSGSRGSGAQIASFYSKLARELHPELPAQLQNLAWLDMDKEEGQEYWAAMELMGEYASANHAIIHRCIAKALKLKVLADVENHHNFAWKEVHDGQELIVHRKGATPAGKGVLGVIPGSMASPAYVVRGQGVPASLHSASHGAGRAMSRTQAIKTFRWKEARKVLEDANVTLLSSGLDEVPMVYKDIRQVMRDQQDLVEIVGQFHPRIVKMAPEGEKAED